MNSPRSRGRVDARGARREGGVTGWSGRPRRSPCRKHSIMPAGDASIGQNGRRARPRDSGCGTASAGACPTRSSAGCPGATSTTSSAGARRRRDTWVDDRVAQRRVGRRSWSRPRRRAPSRPRRPSMPKAMTLPARTPSTAADGALDVLGEHVAAADDDDVLDPPAHDELAVDEVAEVAGAQPAVVEGRVGGSALRS